jgi:hypothetical protein
VRAKKSSNPSITFGVAKYAKRNSDKNLLERKYSENPETQGIRFPVRGCELAFLGLLDRSR